MLYEPDETGLRIAVYIDIFVYDNAPESLDEVERMYDVRDNYFRLINSQNDKTWPEGMLHKASMLLYRLRKVYFKGRCYYVTYNSTHVRNVQMPKDTIPGSAQGLEIFWHFCVSHVIRMYCRR